MANKEWYAVADNIEENIIHLGLDYCDALEAEIKNSNTTKLITIHAKSRKTALKIAKDELGFPVCKSLNL